MGESGHFHITGRAKEMIIRGGENLYPGRDRDRTWGRIPRSPKPTSSDSPTRELGETVLAWIRLRAGVSATEEEIREFCQGKIAHFKIPQYFRFVEHFPLTVTGKVQKFRIRQQEIQERGLEEIAKIKTA